MFDLQILAEKLGQLYPDFSNRLTMATSEFMHRYKMGLFLIESIRTFKKQQDYYDQGRKTPGKIITNALPGSSFHHFGVAADVGFVGDTYLEKLKEADENRYYFLWEELAKLFEANGLTAGARFPRKDFCHCQMAYIPVADMYSIFLKADDLCAVWEEFDRIRGVPSRTEWGDASFHKPVSTEFLRGS